jgi:hypothetical protein
MGRSRDLSAVKLYKKEDPTFRPPAHIPKVFSALTGALDAIFDNAGKQQNERDTVSAKMAALAHS